MIRIIGWLALTWFLFATGIAQAVLIGTARIGTMIFT